MDDQRTNRAGGGIRFRKTRIVWSVVWGVACLLLVVLWVRSSSILDVLQVRISSADVLALGSAEGVCYLSKFPSNTEPKLWRIGYLEMDVYFQGRTSARLPPFGVNRWTPSHGVVTVPHWTASLFFAMVAAAPWHKWPTQFSLRTLLIITTLVGLGLGLIVYAAR
jgi:hypothetical protein